MEFYFLILILDGCIYPDEYDVVTCYDFSSCRSVICIMCGVRAGNASNMVDAHPSLGGTLLRESFYFL